MKLLQASVVMPPALQVSAGGIVCGDVLCTVLTRILRTTSAGGTCIWRHSTKPTKIVLQSESTLQKKQLPIDRASYSRQAVTPEAQLAGICFYRPQRAAHVRATQTGAKAGSLGRRNIRWVRSRWRIPRGFHPSMLSPE